VDWRTILSLAGIILFVVVMMRGCGGMSGGMGSRRRQTDAKDDKAEADSPHEGTPRQ